MAASQRLHPQLKKWLALIVLGGFVVQSFLRLSLFAELADAGRFGYSPIFAHATGLITFVIFAGALLVSVRYRPILRGLAALALAICGVLLVIFDVAARATLPVIFKVMPLDSILDFYCANNSVAVCASGNLTVTAALVAILTTWTLLIWLCLDPLASFAEAVWGWIRKLVGPTAASFGVGGLLLSYFGVWVILPTQMQAREAVYRFLTAPREDVGPQRLVWGTKSAPQITPAANIAPRTLVVITIDSLRADSIELRPGEEGLTPFLQSLAQSGRLHDLGPAASICGFSYCGIVGLQSGRDWAGLESGPPILVSDVLMANNYESYFLLSGRHTSHRNFTNLYGPDVTLLKDDASPDSNDISDDREQIRRLAALDIPDPSRTYLSIHLMSAHAGGFRFNESDPPPDLTTRLVRSLDRAPALYRDQHRQGVRQADRILRDLFAEMRRKNLLDDALVVITSDHGERIEEGEAVGHGEPITLGVSDIPMLIYDTRDTVWPEQTVASQMDVAPTLLESVRIAPLPSFLGSPLQYPLPRNTAPIDGAKTSALVAYFEGHRLLYRCNLETGEAEIITLPTVRLTEAQKAKALAQLPQLDQSKTQRAGADRCFR